MRLHGLGTCSISFEHGYFQKEMFTSGPDMKLEYFGRVQTCQISILSNLGIQTNPVFLANFNQIDPIFTILDFFEVSKALPPKFDTVGIGHI